MKKLYSLITLLTAFVAAGFTSAYAAKNVTINCGYPDAIEVRDGGPEGTVMALTGSATELTFESDAVFIKLIDEDKQFSSVSYNSYSYGTIINNTCTLKTADLQESTDGKCYVNVNLFTPDKISINIPDPSLITVRNGYSAGDEYEITEGLNTFKLQQYGSLWIGVKEPDKYKLTKVWRVSDEKEWDIDKFQSFKLSTSDWKTPCQSGDIFSYTIVPVEEFQPPTFNLTIIGDPSKLSVSVDYGNDLTGLVADQPNKIAMNGNTAMVNISHVNYGTSLYSVKINGKEQQDSYGSYYLSGIRPDDNIEVIIDFPDEDYNVTIASDPVENLPFITSVEVNEQPVENWQQMTIHCGQKIRINLNNNLYNFISITANGEVMDPGYVYSYIDLKIIENSDFVIKSEKYPSLHATLTVNNPEGISASLSGTSLTLSEGDNDIEFTENAKSLNIQRNSGYILNSITTVVGDNEPTVYTETFPSIYLEEGMKITVDVVPMVKDWTYVVYSDIDTRLKQAEDGQLTSEYFYYFSLQDSFDRMYVYPAEGYTTVNFNDLMTQYSISWSPRSSEIVSKSNIYINNELVTLGYPTSGMFTLANGDVLKIFLTKDPATYTATFNVAEGCEVEVLKDLIVPVEDLTATLSELEGTLVQLKNSNTENPIEVYVNNVTDEPAAQADEAENLGTKVEADENGLYNVTLDSSKAISVIKEKQSGVENVTAANIAPDSDVYTVTGTLVLRNATAAQIKALPAGIYIVGNQKVVVR